MRRPSQLIPIRAKTTIYYNSFLPATIIEWNSLPKGVLSARSVPCFKTLLQQTDGQKANPVYSLEYGYEKITHTRLRLGLSSLNEHLLKCNGNHTETTQH
jgi:hypothetical protein